MTNDPAMLDDDELVRRYILQKKQEDEKLKGEQQKADEMRTIAGATEGIGQMLTASPGVTYFKGWGETGAPNHQDAKNPKPNMESLRAQAANTEQRGKKAHEESMNAFGEQEKLRDISTKRRRESEVEEAQNSTDSEEANAYRSMFKKHFPQMDVEGMSVKEMKGILDPVMKSAGMDNDRQMKNLALQDRKDAKDAVAAQKATDFETKQVNELQKRIGKKQDYAADIAGLEGTIAASMGKQSFNLEDANDQKADIPGINIPGYGRSTMLFGGDARAIESDISTFANKVLSERSGAAVTDQELRRLLTELSLGKWNDESDMLRKLGVVKTRLRANMGDVQAGFSPEVQERYKQQGGRLNTDILGEAPGVPGAADAAKKARLLELRNKKAKAGQ